MHAVTRPPLRRFFPSNRGLAGLLVGLGWTALMGLLALLMWVDPDGEGLGTSVGVFGVMGPPLGALAVGFGALFEPDRPARAALAWIATGLLVVGLPVCLVGIYLDGGDDAFSAGLGLSCLMSGALLICAVPTVLFTRSAWEQLAMEARADRLAAALAAVSLQGRVGLNELAAELGVELAALRQELDRAIQDRHFTGYVNWNEGVMYSEQAAALQQAGRCPGCNGAMALAGHRVIQCPHCETEVFLA